ncbi:MAG: aminopeptidase [Isosphaeraceae bacterium]|nr:aminopeptidase [Isosphaeraceae bacterium]
MLTEDIARRWADLLTGYCLDLNPGELVAITAEIEARPLIESCWRAVIDRGAHPLLRLDLPGLHEYQLNHATEEMLAHVPATSMQEALAVDARIRISAETDTRSAATIDPARQAIHDRARGPLRTAARRARWVLTQFPTAAYASDAGMSLEEYERFVVAAMFLDRDDPAEAWRELGRRQAGLVEFMSSVSRIRIEAEDTDITLDVGGRTWMNSDGRRNMPSGEIYTGPIEDSANGRLRCGFPVCRDGRELVGIELRFEAGRVVEARAEEGEEYLRSMIGLDEGASRLGELGLGLNSGIDRFTGSILYDEKIGGTVHLALGQSYRETGGVNDSALHWDLIVDTRRGGRITADGRCVMEDGRWSVG